ncbi:DUF1295 domain-containing protein [Parvularcula sp. ZS-1/3]|uniref:DUF1295 domain-containing protein n=1 Tax=Parvularcula mediterranea TaxID=2732508 RepID=A0A7Y3RNS9_9PROT|nr:DUF1295 domain-containing protein [Parvularcula mediterranea]NNU16647.1 DUF1295 domain-containing protein [Parvularcula mediterranea]
MKAVRGIIVALVTALIGYGVAWTASQSSIQVSLPFYVGGLFLLCGILSFAINWLVFIPSAMARTEKFYDLTGSITYLSMMGLALALTPSLDLRAKLAAGAVILWSLRLGLFLFTRISADGHDRRFAEIKINPFRFLAAWSIQALWCLLTAAAALAIITSPKQQPLDIFLVVGGAMWVIGFLIEVIADEQKKAFRKDPANAGKFIDKGLWSRSRHPNYFGEILLWTGMAVAAIPVLTGGLWITLISPLFVTLLLTKVSGIPLLDASARKRWGDDPEYRAYRKRTPALIPRLGS